MGYYSDFKLEFDYPEILSGTSHEVVEWLKQNTGYLTGWYIQHDEIHLDYVKWYNHPEDMQKLSLAFPTLKFELTAEGEDGEQWMVVATGGKTQRCDSVITFTEHSLW